MSLELQDRVALVTGANRGIGKAVLEGLLDAGAAKVYAAVRRLDSTAPLVEEHGDRVVPVEVDYDRPETITAAAKSATDVTVVVNNAGILKSAQAIDEAAEDAFAQELTVNVYGLLRVARAFAPVIEANGGGALVQLNSVASIKNFAAFATYSASKAAAYSLTQGLRDDLAPKGVHVVSVHPGPIDTDMADQAGLPDGDPPSVVSDAIVEALRAGAFHAFPDRMAKDVWSAYQSFAENVVESQMAEA